MTKADKTAPLIEAYHRGQDDYYKARRGEIPMACPYAEGTAQADSWQRGVNYSAGYERSKAVTP